MRLFLAEKPEVARKVAAGIGGAQSRGEGYIKIGDNIITWGFGHLLELCDPEKYGEEYAKWSLDSLPLPIPDKYQPIAKSKDQLKIVCNLIKSKDVDEIVHCGDADEEGQLLIDEVLAYAKNTKPVKRILLHDTSPSAVAKEIATMRPNSEFKGISESGYARSQADWLVGLSLTRAWTILINRKQVISVGRVQTPMLGLIVSRDLEKENHKASNYYPVMANFKIDGRDYIDVKHKGDDPLSEDEAKQICEECKGKNAVLNVKKENKQTPPPLPYNQLKLQAECAARWSYNPDETLQITQDLRMKYDAITYNRGDCEYLPESVWVDRERYFRNLNGVVSLEGIDKDVKSRAFNDANITAHFAIMPSETVDMNVVARMNEKEKRVFLLIAERFMLQFYPNKEYISYSLSFKVGEHEFSKVINKVTKLGWSAKSKDENAKDEEELNYEPQGGNGVCEECRYEIKQTKPKPYYTLTSFLNDLTRVVKYVSDKKIAALLKEKDKDKEGEHGGIGTASTRAECIKKLFDRGYIEKKGNNIISTALGRELIANSPDILAKPDLTALWFEKQKDIREGKLSRSEFLKEVRDQIAETIDENKERLRAMTLDQTYKCDVCGKGFLQRMKRKDGKGYFWGCSEYKQGCKNILSDLDGKPNFDEKKYKCSVCGKGYLKRIARKDGKGYFWGCSNYADGCKNIVNDLDGKPDLEGKGNEKKSKGEATGVQCPFCKKGELMKFERVSAKTKKPYICFSCNRYPDCRHDMIFADAEGKPDLSRFNNEE